MGFSTALGGDSRAFRDDCRVKEVDVVRSRSLGAMAVYERCIWHKLF